MEYPTDLTPVIVESPFASCMVPLHEGASEHYCSEQSNLSYLRAIMHDCLVNHHEAPYASHGLYTQPGVLRDDIPKERLLGMGAGFVWASLCKTRVVYLDRGVSRGMKAGLRHALKIGQNVHVRRLRGGWDLGFILKDHETRDLLLQAGVSVESL